MRPYWNTAAGSLGIYPTQDWLYIQLSANSPASPTIIYNFLNGELPAGISFDPKSGVISGSPTTVVAQTSYHFTIRAIDGVGNITDRSFSFELYDRVGIKITTPVGKIIDTLDSVYINYQIQYTNPLNQPVIFSISSGDLPDGLYLSESGVISGWPVAPTALTTSVLSTSTSTFAVSLTSPSGRDTVQFSIVVRNHNLTNPPNTRTPAIINDAPLQLPVLVGDSLYSYYMDGYKLPDATSGEEYSFKIIGHDFDNDAIVYQFANMPPGLSGNPNTGWISGKPVIAANTLSEYKFSVTIAKTRNLAIVSKPKVYTMMINNGVIRDIAWVSPTDLGTVDNGSICNLSVKATATSPVQYVLVDGKLPPNIKLMTTGRLIGRFPFQPTTSLLTAGDQTTFTFTISAFSPSSPLNASERTFTITVNQTFAKPYETLYIKAYPDITSKKILNSLLTDETLIPKEYLYRSDDYNFGKAIDVRIAQQYGVQASGNDQYVAAMSKNHYMKRLVLGTLQYAQATDANNDIMYEVVYCPVFDDLSNDKGESVPKEVFWKEPINLYDNIWITSNAEDNTSETVPYTSLAPGHIASVFPNSLLNMRKQIASQIPQYTDQSLLPKWMTSQQSDGTTLGFMPVWVLCYTLPGKAQTIIDNINNNWGHTLNDIDFQIDRYIVDKTSTYNWNTNLANPTWVSLPSAYPPPTVVGAHDIAVLFPQETIFPNR